MPVSLTCRTVPAFPVRQAGRLPHHNVSRPAQRSLALRPAWLLSRPWRPVPSECFNRGRYLPQPLRLLPAGATVAGRDSHPLGKGAFHGALSHQCWQRGVRARCSALLLPSRSRRPRPSVCACAPVCCAGAARRSFFASVCVAPVSVDIRLRFRRACAPGLCADPARVSQSYSHVLRGMFDDCSVRVAGAPDWDCAFACAVFGERLPGSLFLLVSIRRVHPRLGALRAQDAFAHSRCARIALALSAFAA